jgi:hypothetical protein
VKLHRFLHLEKYAVGNPSAEFSVRRVRVIEWIR